MPVMHAYVTGFAMHAFDVTCCVREPCPHANELRGYALGGAGVRFTPQSIRRATSQSQRLG